MTSFLTQNIGGPVIGSMVGSDKGDFSNRVNCAGSQLKNNLSTALQDTVVIGGAVGALHAAHKSPKVRGKFAQIFDKGVKIAEAALNKGNGSQLGKRLLDMSKSSKALALIGIPTALLLSFIGGKHIYKMGQIDQRYTDKAKIEEHTKDSII